MVSVRDLAFPRRHLRSQHLTDFHQELSGRATHDLRSGRCADASSVAGQCRCRAVLDVRRSRIPDVRALSQALFSDLLTICNSFWLSVWKFSWADDRCGSYLPAPIFERNAGGLQ